MNFRGLILCCVLFATGCGHAPTITDYVKNVDGKDIAFEMVYIPGDRESGIEPFYIGRTEVTWDMFLYWALAKDLQQQHETRYDFQMKWLEQSEKGLRPSSLNQDYLIESVIFSNQPTLPVINLSWRTAELYCQWLSEQTGRSYRLPTDQEWLYVLKLSGGVPEDSAELLELAVLRENAPCIYDRHGRPVPLPGTVASGQPNQLGLYDLLGNAAEWVQPNEQGKWVRGGHFGLRSNDLSARWRSEEDLDIWMASWPSFPRSKYYYMDHYYQGIRLVCEAD